MSKNTVKYENMKETSIEIPEGITYLEENSFKNNLSLVKITIPSTLREIPANAFLGNKLLENFEVHPENKHFKSIKGVLFSIDGNFLVHYPEGKKESNYVITPNVKDMHHSAFNKAHNLKTLTIGNIEHKLLQPYYKD